MANKIYEQNLQRDIWGTWFGGNSYLKGFILTKSEECEVEFCNFLLLRLYVKTGTFSWNLETSYYFVFELRIPTFDLFCSL